MALAGVFDWACLDVENKRRLSSVESPLHIDVVHFHVAAKLSAQPHPLDHGWYQQIRGPTPTRRREFDLLYITYMRRSKPCGSQRYQLVLTVS